MSNERIDTAAVLSWYTGKKLEAARVALEGLQASLEAGYWLPGGSRKIRAALNKTRTDKMGSLLDRLPAQRGARPHADSTHTLMMAFRYADHEVLRVDFAKMEADQKLSEEERELVAQGRLYVEALRPVVEAMERLDATRPQPVFTHLGVSPTVTATLKSLGLDGQIGTLRVPEIRWEKFKVTNERGSYWTWVGTILWPEGTVHNASRYFWSADNRQCQACGHAIRNDANWVPMIIDNAHGVPYSLWVGTDCAHSVFGIKVSNPLPLSRT